MLPNTKNQKASQQFISYLKNTPEIPKKSLSQSKENMNPTHVVVPKQPKKEQKQSQSRVIEGDFSKISTSYVLEGNKLTKKEQCDEKKPKPSVKETDKENQQIKSRKQIIKLQYLQKMGVLKPEEQAILQKYRQKNPKPVQKQEHQKSNSNHKNQELSLQQGDLYHPLSNKFNFYSPKAMQKNAGGLYSPKYDNGYGYAHYPQYN